MEYDLHKYLPPVVSNIKDLNAILDVESMELRRLSIKIFQINSNYSIYTCDDDTLEQWADLLNISFSSTDTIENKRQQILSVVNLHRPYTLKSLYTQLDSILGQNSYEIDLNYSAQTLTVLIYLNVGIDQKTKLTVEKMLINMVPSHIGTTVTLGSVVETTTAQYHGVYIQQSSVYDIDFS